MRTHAHVPAAPIGSTADKIERLIARVCRERRCYPMSRDIRDVSETVHTWHPQVNVVALAYSLWPAAMQEAHGFGWPEERFTHQSLPGEVRGFRIGSTGALVTFLREIPAGEVWLFVEEPGGMGRWERAWPEARS